MRASSRKCYYPLDLDRIARDVADRGIDIAPTRLTWERLARCCATLAGEQGRDAFHLMAAVWPDYSRHDSELCYNRALRKTDAPVSAGYLVALLKRYGMDLNHVRYRSVDGKPLIINITHKKTKKQMKKISFNAMVETLPNGRSLLGCNPLIDLLLRIYPQTTVVQAVTNYYLGFSAFKSRTMGDALIFWQINEDKQIVNAKRVYYRADGHRDKKLPPMVMYPDNPQCLFGQHLLMDAPPDQPVAIVESEKSAIVMSIIMPGYLWMACGSMNNFNEQFLKPLQGRAIVAFPDVDIKRDKKTNVSVSCALWQNVAAELQNKGWNITVDTALEETVNSAQRMDKIDVADLALERAIKQQLKRLKR